MFSGLVYVYCKLEVLVIFDFSFTVINSFFDVSTVDSLSSHVVEYLFTLCLCDDVSLWLI